MTTTWSADGLSVGAFPIDVLKLDRAFVTRVMADDQGSAIVKTILGLARNPDLEAIAEGIEDRDQLRELSRLGCRFGQGYLLGRPLEPASLQAAMVASGNARRLTGLASLAAVG